MVVVPEISNKMVSGPLGYAFFYNGRRLQGLVASSGEAGCVAVGKACRP